MDPSLLPYTVDGQDFDAAVFQPDNPGPHPAVLVCHAWGGRDTFAESKARALADLGYVGAAIDVYGVGRRGTDRDSNRALMGPLLSDRPALRRRLSAALDAVHSLPAVDRHHTGAIGYCFGGLCVMEMVRSGLPLRAGVSFHGLLDVAQPPDAQAVATLQLHHGQDDPMVPPQALGPFAEEMQRVHADWQLHAYAGAQHAFTNPQAQDPAFGTVHHPAADRCSWREALRFLDTHLKSPRA